MRFRTWHYAECSNCKHKVGDSATGTFLSDFFLPDYCEGCGKYLTPRRYETRDLPHWVHVALQYEWIPAVRTRNPLTWFRSGHWKAEELSRYAVS